MTAPAAPTPDALLRLCGDAAPAPWYPGPFAKATGTDRDALDDWLNRLRLAGLVRLTDWQPGTGQGYALTDAGRAVLDNPRALARLRAGDTPAAADSIPAVRPARTSAWERGEAVRNALHAPGGAPVTGVLIAAQVVAFMAGLFFAQRAGMSLNVYFMTGQSAVSDRLAVFGFGVATGDWYRLLTYGLVHGGGLHLLVNLMGHVLLGPTVERMYGSVRFLLLWLLADLGGGCAAVLAHPRATTVGSSGALCGLILAAAVFIGVNRRHLNPVAVAAYRRSLVSVIVLNVLISFVPRISWSGHLGGAVVGAVAGVLLNYQRFGTLAQRWAAVLGLILLPAVCVAPLYQRGLLRLSRPIRDEVTDYRTRLEPVVQQTRRHATAMFDDHVEPLRDTRPEDRDAGRVKSAVAALTELRDEQEAARQFVAATGPYPAAPVEQARAGALGYLTGQVKVSELYTNCLRRGRQWGDRDETELQRVLNITLEAELLWRKATAQLTAAP